MTVFTHHTTIETDSPVLKAAYAIAKKAHMDSGQGRGKYWPGTSEEIPYLVHPIMLYELLVHFGETDEVTLAAALLHDAKEDLEEYQNDPNAMQRDLADELAKNGVTDHREIAYYIDELCDELTNGRVMEEGKRIWQVEHVGNISLRAAKVKIFDQMASVLDNIISPDDKAEKKGNRWTRNWCYKALDVVKATVARNPQLAFYGDMFKVLFKYNMNVVDADERHRLDPSDTSAAELRAAFDFDYAETRARSIQDNRQPDIEPVATLDHKRAKIIETGVSQVKLAADGRITHYTILTNPYGDKRDLRNETAIDFMGALEESSTHRRVTVGPREILDGRLVRINSVKPPIPAEEFIALAKDSHALEKSFATAIRDKARELGEGRGV